MRIRIQWANGRIEDYSASNVSWQGHTNYLRIWQKGRERIVPWHEISIFDAIGDDEKFPEEEETEPKTPETGKNPTLDKK